MKVLAFMWNVIVVVLLLVLRKGIYCRATGPVSTHRAWPIREADERVGCTYPMLLLGGCYVVGKPWDTTGGGEEVGVGKHSLRYRRARAGSGVPRPVTRLGPSGSQDLGHPGDAGSHIGAESGHMQARSNPGPGLEGSCWKEQVPVGPSALSGESLA